MTYDNRPELNGDELIVLNRAVAEMEVTGATTVDQEFILRAASLGYLKVDRFSATKVFDDAIKAHGWDEEDQP